MKIGYTTNLNQGKNIRSFLERISSAPSILLENYLLDLVVESDGKESSIYLKGIESFIAEIWNEMVRNNWRELKISFCYLAEGL